MSLSTAGPIVVGIDGSGSAMNAVRWAAELTAQRNRTLRLVHALDEVAWRYTRALPVAADLDELYRTRGHRLLRQAQELACEVAPGIDIETAYDDRRAVEALRAESERASLLVLGTLGLRPVGRVLVGSVSVTLAAHAKCPVALIRPHAGEDRPPAEGPVVVGVDGSPTHEAAIGVGFERPSAD